MSATAATRRRKPVKEIPVYNGPTMAHVGFQGARHMHPERMPSARSERTTAIRLFDTSEETLENVENQSKNARILIVNGLKMNQLSDGVVQRMLLLEKLDLSENQLGDASLPEAFKKLEHLVELNLSNNKFTKMPTALKKLKNLSRLSISYNNVDSLKGIEKLKKMQVLMLDHNKFSQVFKEVTHMRKLEILDCSHNTIREVGLDVRFLKNLKELNISKNKISVLPTDIFQLKNLESFKASQNQISKIPVFNMNPQHCHCISEIDLSNNMINKFPGHLLTISQKLDLSSNRLKTLDYSKMKKVEMGPGKELSVEGNPLTFPPMDVCESGLKSMMRFFQETELNTKMYQGVKILVLGAPKSGKTSFVQTFADGQPRLSEEMYEKSAGIEVSDMNIEDVPENEPPPPISLSASKKPQTSAKVTSAASGSKSGRRTPTIEQNNPNQKQHSKQTKHLPTQVLNGVQESDDVIADDNSSTASSSGKRTLNMTIWDFCGHPFYLFPHYMFFEQPAIAILTFNMHSYRSEHFEEVISSWFDWMIAKTNKLCVLLVGTHADKLKKEKIKQVCNEVKAKLQAHAERQRQIVQRRIDVITEKPHISQTLSAQLNAYSLLLQEKFIVQSEVIITSAAKNTGYETVAASIEMLSNDSRQFPNVLRVIPTFWLDVESFLEEKGNTMVVPMVKFDQLKEEIGAKFGMKHLVSTIVQYLHETGKALWFANNPAMKGVVILRPAWFFDVFRAVFRHDLKEKLDVEVEDSFKMIGITQSKYDQMKEEFLTEGIVDRDLLKCMMSHLLPLETNGPFMEVLNLFMDNLDLGYVVTKKPGGYNLDPDTEGMISRKYLLPWFRNVPEPPSVSEVWGPLEGKQRLAGVCRFPKYMPPGLFEMLSVRAHKGTHNLRFLSHWGSGFHAKHKTDKLQLMFTYYGHEDDNGTTLRFELRDDTHDPNEDAVSGSHMWSVLLPLLMDLEELLHSYTGVLVERLMECPGCRLLTFQGEWLTPKETQGLPTRPCEECNENIDTAFLVQPREKKRDDVRFNLAKIRQKKRQALAGSEDSNRPGKFNAPLHANVRTGRRTAILPMDNVTVDSGGRYGSVSSAVGSDLDSDTEDVRTSRHQSAVGLLPGLTEGEMMSFITKQRELGNAAENDVDRSQSPPANGSGLLSGFNSTQMVSFLKRHSDGANGDERGYSSDETNDEQNIPASRGLLPGLSADQMASFLQKHANESGSDNESDDVTPPTSFMRSNNINSENDAGQ
ncbi:malignant fibrous histiocytoma-amplified sequence 1-like isoform X2 [Mya arenaria]|uniref:malignant fibrous histiocytoma-amplified sequence 1-like isoform X2 n=1 Tax=Mya arenaria TaxID=6604 RepID=UPI0022E23767|nr:malignant fibrous histiocytoma-amplified sequence 1-like isoform X2 [Mya arenaria]